MASADIQIPPSSIIVPGSRHLAPFSFPRPSNAVPQDVASIASTWVSGFNEAARNGDFGLSELFLKVACWRDFLCLTWDFRTLQGPEKIASVLKSQAQGWRIRSVKVDDSSHLRKPSVSAFDATGVVKGIQSFLTVETDVGRGRGIVRLLPDDEDNGKWKVFTLFTTLEELAGLEESINERRPSGVEHGALLGRKNWKEMRVAEAEYEGREPAVLIIGAGQAGLASAARLKQVGVDALIVDRCSHIGDNWRNRYHQLVLHDPVWYDHMPYLNFPPNWPIFCPKDKLAQWFESYANILELNIWTTTTITASEWDEKDRKWTIVVDREKDGKKTTRTFHPRHIIQATGHSGEAYVPTDIEGINDFQGDRLVHSSQFIEPTANAKGKKAVVIGSCNSAHDVAQDYYEHGYDVTMVQRSSTTVVQSKTLMDVIITGLYSENGPPVEDADLLNMSNPNPLSKALHIEATKETTRRDAPLLQGLQTAGFALDSGPDHAGLFMKYLHRGGGYYIDVGTSQLIVDGRIKIHQGRSVLRIVPHGVILSAPGPAAPDADANDGNTNIAATPTPKQQPDLPPLHLHLPADEIVLATGFQNMRSTTRRIFGDAVADRVHDVWGFDEEGETRTMWRDSGHEGFWFAGGNLALCRFFSRLLALRIAGVEMERERGG